MIARFRTFKMSLAVLAPLGLIGCGGGGAGFLGLQDYQRDLLFSVGGGLAGALLDNVLGNNNANDNTSTEQGQPGAPGAQGDPGPAGPALFTTFVETFYNGVVDDVFGVTPVVVDDPILGANGQPIAFLASIPANAETGNPINIRILLERSGPCAAGCLVFTIDGRIARPDSPGTICLAGSGANCDGGSRWIQLSDLCADDAAADSRRFVEIDLPLTDPRFGFAAIQAGDVLAIELATARDDGGAYHVMGVEVSDSPASLVATVGVFSTLESVPATCSQ